MGQGRFDPRCARADFGDTEVASFVDTLKELLEGGHELFEGLEAYGRRDWSVRFPVVCLEFGRGNVAETDQPQVDLPALVDGIAGRNGMTCRYNAGPLRLADS